MHRRLVLTLPLLAAWPMARAHHGWSSFDLSRPLWLEGQATRVSWRNPHAEFEIDIGDAPALPADLAQRTLPAQAAAVDGAKLLREARLPTRRDRRWLVELAPLTRMEAWKVVPLRVGDRVGVLGYTFGGEQGDAVLRAEFLFAGGRVAGLRSSPA